MSDIGLKNTVTTLCTCWKLSRKDGIVMGFTDYAKSLTIDGVTYEAKTGYAATTISSSNGLSVDNLDTEGALSSEGITEADITDHKYDFASIEIFQVNYLDLSAEPRKLRTGVLGNISRGDNAFTAEMRGLGQLAQRNIGELYADTCRAALGDDRCQVNMANYTHTATVVAIGDDSFTISIGINKAAGYFTKGLLTVTSGENNGVSMEITKHTKDGGNDVLTPFMALPAALTVGDTMTVKAGCDGKFTTCQRTFGNYLNFRAEPNIPGTDLIYSYPTS